MDPFQQQRMIISDYISNVIAQGYDPCNGIQIWGLFSLCRFKNVCAEIMRSAELKPAVDLSGIVSDCVDLLCYNSDTSDSLSSHITSISKTLEQAEIKLAHCEDLNVMHCVQTLGYVKDYIEYCLKACSESIPGVISLITSVLPVKYHNEAPASSAAELRRIQDDLEFLKNPNTADLIRERAENYAEINALSV